VIINNHYFFIDIERLKSIIKTEEVFMDKKEIFDKIAKLKEKKDNQTDLYNFWNGLDLKYRKDMEVVEKVLDANTNHNDFLQRKLLNGSGAYSNKVFYQKLLNNKKNLSASVIEKLDVIEDVKRNGLNLVNHFNYQNDTDVVRYAVKQNGMALEYADPIFKGDYNTVKMAVNRNGNALQFASADLRNEPDIVAVAVKNDGNALQYATHYLRNDFDLVSEAVENNGNALRYASYHLRNDRDIVVKAVKNQPESFEYAGDNFDDCDDREIMLFAVKGNPSLLCYLAPELQDDPDITLNAIATDGMALEYADPAFQSNPEFVRIAVKNNGHAIKYASPDVKEDPEIRKLSINEDSKVKILKR
jgi:hypothetical protein